MVRDQEKGAEALAVGARIHLQPAGVRTADRYEVAVRGWDVGRFILTDMPNEKKVVETFKVGTEWVARSILRGKAYGFRTEIIRVQFDPRPLVFLRYPESIEALAIRKHQRINTFIIASLSRLEESGTVLDTVECVVRDLSRGGCLAEADIDLSVGDKVALTFVLPNGERVEGIPAQVRNTRPSDEKRFTGGVMFSEDADQKRIVDAFFDRMSGGQS
jgi:hypothetical protein